MPEYEARHVPPEVPEGFVGREPARQMMDHRVVANVDREVVGVAAADRHAQDVAGAEVLELEVGQLLEASVFVAELDQVEVVGFPILRAGVVDDIEIEVLLEEVAAQREAVALSHQEGEADQVVPPHSVTALNAGGRYERNGIEKPSESESEASWSEMLVRL